MPRSSAIAATTAALLLSLCGGPPSRAAASWTPPVDASQVVYGAQALATLVDNHGNEHLIYEAAVNEFLDRAILHTYRAPGGTWSQPTVVSFGFGPLFPDRAGSPFFTEDATGRLHLFFEAIEGIGVRQVWHTTLESSDPGAGWSEPVDTTRASQPAFAEAFSIDSAGTLHLVFRAIPGLGSSQLFHAYHPDGGSWSEPVQVSHTEQGASFPDTRPHYRPLQEDGAGSLHLFFEAIPDVLGVRQIWHSSLDVASPAGGWTTPVNLSQSPQPADTVAMLVDGENDIHVFFGAWFLGVTQLFHAYLPPGGSWSSPVRIADTGYRNTLPNTFDESPFVLEDGAGLLHVFLESIGSFGVRQVWHTDLDTSSPGAGWSEAVDVSRFENPATAVSVTLDETGTLHLVFRASPLLGTPQLFHVHRAPGEAFSSPVQVSHTGQEAGPPTPAGSYRFLVADGAGGLHLLFESVPGIDVTQVWHTALRTADPEAGWSQPTNVSQASEPASTEAFVVDGSGALHVVFRAIPGQGTVQLFHARRPAGGEWAAPTMLSHTGQGARLADWEANYRFVHQHGGHLHLSFDAIPGPLGFPVLWHTELPLDPSILFADGFESGDGSRWSNAAP